MGWKRKIRKKRGRRGLLSGWMGERGSRAKLENLIPIDDIHTRGPWESIIHFRLSRVSRVTLLDIPMTTLAKDAAAFRSALARQDYTSWHSNPAPPQAPGDAGGEESGEKKKKKKSKNSTCHLPFLLDSRSERPGFRCRVFAASGYRYGEQRQHTAGLCGCTPEGLNVFPRLEIRPT